MASTAPEVDIEPCVERWPGAVDLLDLHEHDPQRYPFLLESSAGAVGQGRFDILFAFPGERLVLERGRLVGPCAEAGDFLAALDRWFVRDGRPETAPGLPFAGGWFVYLGYEVAGQVEPTLDLPQPPETGLPDAAAVRCPAAVIRDRRDGGVFLVAESASGDLMDALHEDLAALDRPPARRAIAGRVRADAPQTYRDHVRAIREYVQAGDVFQVNLSREWRVELSESFRPAELYDSLRRSNPAPFAGLMRWGDASLVSSSPERLLRLDGEIADTRPIAGTRARHAARLEDNAATAELMGHPKERAEHVMLIDLERNDLGRVCEYGSVHVNELMTLESYAHVHHIVSNVRGRLRAGIGPGAALRAVFPGGTITGCPKVRCMEIIAELEAIGRGPYTGAMGYLGRDGRLDSNILIRSLAQHGRQVRLRAGAGIVADSDPQKELEETEAKARGLLLSLGQLK